MKTSPILLAILMIFLSFSRCSDEHMDELVVAPMSEYRAPATKRNINSYRASKVNDSRRDIAARLAASLKNKEFRKFLKEEALKQVDEDYNVYFRELSAKSVSGKGLAIDHIYPPGRGKSGRDKTEEVEALDMGLIISIPVHAEEWDEENFTPPVFYLPEYYNESTAETVIGYDAEGNEITLSAQEEPDYPVIVVRPSDRIDAEGNILYGQGANKSNGRIAINQASSTIAATSYETPPDCSASPVTSAPTNLTVQRYGVNNQIYVTWSAVPNATLYTIRVYGQTTKTWNYVPSTSYTSAYINVSGGEEAYTIEVKGRNCSGSGPAAQVTTNSCVPSSIPYNLRTDLSGSGTVSVDWSQTSNSQTEGYHLYYRRDYMVHDAQGNYTTVEGTVWNKKTTNTATDTDYLLTNLSPGFYMTKVKAYNSCGMTYDSDWSGNFASTRVPGRTEKIKRYKFTDVKHWEGWTLGKLEWKVWVVMGNGTNAGKVTEALYKSVARSKADEWIDINLPVLSAWRPTVNPNSKEESPIYTVLWAELDHVCECVTNFSVTMDAKYAFTKKVGGEEVGAEQTVEVGTNLTFNVDINKAEGDNNLPLAFVNYWDAYGTAKTYQPHSKFSFQVGNE